MEKFRKKPVVTEAEQFLPFEDDMGKPQSNVLCVFMDIANSETNWSIKTLEGRYDVTPNDWIIKGIEGERYPCKPEIFKKTYDHINSNVVKDDDEKIQDLRNAVHNLEGVPIPMNIITQCIHPLQNFLDEYDNEEVEQDPVEKIISDGEKEDKKNAE